MYTFVWCVRGALQYGGPMHEVMVVDGTEMDEGLAWVSFVLLELVDETS